MLKLARHEVVGKTGDIAPCILKRGTRSRQQPASRVAALPPRAGMILEPALTLRIRERSPSLPENTRISQSPGPQPSHYTDRADI